MISFRPIGSPQCLSDLAAADPMPEFDAPGAHDCLKRLVRRDLLVNQAYQCAYCESPIENDGTSCHLAHIASQKDAPNRRFDISNLMAACQAQDRCGHGHGEASVPDELNPYLAQKLHERFHCAGDGKLTARGLSEDAENFALGPMNLNAPGLKTYRAGIIMRLMNHTIALGTNNRRKIRNLSTLDRGLRSLHYQILGRHGFPEP